MTTINVETMEEIFKNNSDQRREGILRMEKTKWNAVITSKSREMDKNVQDSVKKEGLMKLIEGAMQPLSCKVYQEEIKERIRRRKKDMERGETVQYTSDENMSLINFDKIIQIAGICRNNDIDNIINQKDNNGKVFHAEINKTPDNIKISITDREYELSISFAEVYDRISKDFVTTISFSYRHYPTKSLISFIATDSCILFEHQDRYIDNVALSKTLIPITSKGNMVLWSEVRGYKMFNQEDLNFIISMLNANIKKEEEKGTAKK